MRLFAFGTRSSKPEERLYSVLVHKFGDDDVKRQIKIGRWRVDFYVKKIDTYVELDGAHWHGLKRPIEEIALDGTRMSRGIVAKHHMDRLQDAWFGENSLKLIRIRDDEIRGKRQSELSSLLDERLCGTSNVQR